MEWPPHTLCNGDDRGQWPKQGGAVGAAACKMRVPLQGTKQMQGAAPRHEADAGCRNPNIFSGNFMILFAVWKCLRTPPNRFFHEKYPNYKRNLSRLLPSPSVPAPSERGPLAKLKSLTERVRREKQLPPRPHSVKKGSGKIRRFFQNPIKIFFL